MLGLLKSKKKTTWAKILVADDEPDLVSSIQYRLEWSNCEVVTIINTKERLEKAANERPEHIMMDINMPAMNGHERLKCPREHPDLKDIPVIMVTVIYEPQDIATASSYGISNYVTKPFDFTELMEKSQIPWNI